MICGQTCDASYFTWSILGYPWIPADQVSLGQTHRCPGDCGTFHILPTGLHGLCFGFCFAGPLPLRSLLHGPLSRVHFGESLVVRLYSEIDCIHLSSEAQCVSHLYPQVDCHTRCFQKVCESMYLGSPAGPLKNISYMWTLYRLSIKRISHLLYMYMYVCWGHLG